MMYFYVDYYYDLNYDDVYYGDGVGDATSFVVVAITQRVSW